LGAEYFLRKPVELRELVRCVRTLLAAAPDMKAEREAREKESLSRGALRVESRRMTVWLDGRLVATLSHKEFALIRELIQSHLPIAKEELLRRLGYRDDQVDALKQVLHRLREHLGPNARDFIRTTPEGYELVA
jgi:DNA-binding response OmpR family regulator